MNDWWNTVVHFVNTQGSNGLIDALAGAIASALLALIILVNRKSMLSFSKIVEWVSAVVRKDRKDYKFEKAYLAWIINHHQYLGLLPAHTVTARWGEERSTVDLENVYVTLQVSTRKGDRDATKASSRDTLPWRKPTWTYLLVTHYQWLGVSLIFMILLSLLFTFVFYSYAIPSLGPSGSSPVPFSVFLWLITVYLAGIFLYILLSRWGGKWKEEPYQPGDLGQVIDRQKQLVIRGDPGSGKTTLLRYLAVTCARALRNDEKKGDASDLVQKRLLWTIRPFPILVTLRRHNDVGSWGQEKLLLHSFSEEMPAELRKQYPEGFFERKLKKGNCLILLDAFDELGSSEARAAMGRRIGGFLAVYNHPGNRVVVTTRKVGYEGQLDQYGFQIRTVQKLNAGEVRALVKQRYWAIALSETYGWKSHDAAPVLQRMQQRSERLIKKIESTPRLAQLATNPLLLSLIVLVHRVKLELPQERVLLYRDCVEILTEQWQRSKQAEIDMVSEAQEDLTLSQKLVLLQELALNMQRQREKKNQRTLLPRIQVQEIIARKLPDILGSQLPATEPERQEMCQRKAEAWIASIQVESGILVEQGLDEAGDALICFSHLTFQEYLAAVAINEDPHYQPLLRSHLLQPTWSEVVLLYVALAKDATATVAQLLAASIQPAGVLLAGSCLAERVRHIKNETQQLALAKLKEGFEQANGQAVTSFGQVLAAVGGNEVTTFMRGQLQNTMIEKRLEAVKALGHTKPNDPQIKDVQEDLVKLVETPNNVVLVIAARESLAQIGDSRFTSKEPVLVSIPQQLSTIPSSPKSWKELIVSPEWVGAKKLRQKLPLIIRVYEYWVFSRFHPLRQKLPQKHAFEIGKYLVTNIEYARFVASTGHRTPEYWIEGTFPTEKATHPVTGIIPKDAKAYCKWLSQETGKTYRLPTEWEWEWAATGPHGQRYPWGDQFDKDKCNTKDSAIGETTPVGSYLTGINQYGMTDMSGNVWEITQGGGKVLSSHSLSGKIILVGTLIESILTAIISTNPLAIALPILFLMSIPGSAVLGALSGLILILRGGAFNTLSDQATCFFREEYTNSIKEVGFRCVRDA